MLCLLNDNITKHDHEVCKLEYLYLFENSFLPIGALEHVWKSMHSYGHTYLTISQRFLNNAFSILIWNSSCSWDLLMTFPSSEAKNLSSNFIKYLNNFHPTFNFQLNPLSAFLLWFYVKLHNGHKNTTLYNKLTNNHGYIFLAEHIIKFIVYSQSLCYNSICFDPFEILNWWNKIRKLNFSSNEINRLITTAKSIPWENLLKEGPQKPNNIISLAVTFNSQFKPFKHSTNKL